MDHDVRARKSWETAGTGHFHCVVNDIKETSRELNSLFADSHSDSKRVLRYYALMEIIVS